MTVRFDANVMPGLPWRFVPEQNEIKVRIGEVVTINYKVINQAARDVSGQASYNVTPPTAGAYFHKINCFCFTEQRLKAGETREMAVVFYVDPKLADDPEHKNLHTITLSYSFYLMRERDRPVAEVAGAEQEQSLARMVPAGGNRLDHAEKDERRRRWLRLTPSTTTIIWSTRARGRRSVRCPPSSWRSAP